MIVNTDTHSTIKFLNKLQRVFHTAKTMAKLHYFLIYYVSHGQHLTYLKIIYSERISLTL